MLVDRTYNRRSSREGFGSGEMIESKSRSRAISCNVHLGGAGMCGSVTHTTRSRCCGTKLCHGQSDTKDKEACDCPLKGAGYRSDRVNMEGKGEIKQRRAQIAIFMSPKTELVEKKETTRQDRKIVRTPHTIATGPPFGIE